MNTKIQKLANTLYNNEEYKNQKFSLTLNYNKVIEHEYVHENIPNSTAYRCIDTIYPLLNEEGMKRIADELSKVEVKNFNFTIEFEHGQEKGFEHYSKDWYSCRITFWGDKKKIKIAFNMLSSYCSFDHGEFDRSVGKLKLNEDEYPKYVQAMLELKNTLIDNGNRLLSKCQEIKKLK
jgi:hypothetical protein